MKINIPPALWHHSLKAAVLLLTAQAVVAELPYFHWTRKAANITLSIIGGLLLALSALHAQHCDHCPRCRPKPPHQLTRPRYRAALTLGRYAPAVLTVFAATFVIGLPLVTADHATKEHTPSLAMLAVRVAAVALVGSLASAWRFYRLNDPVRARARTTHEWIKRNAQWFRHNSHTLELAAMALFIVTVFLPRGGIYDSLNGFAVVAVFGASFMTRQHQMSLCEQCVYEFRTDAPEYAAARTWRFTAMHRYTTPAGLAALVGILAAVTLLDGLLENVVVAASYSLLVAQVMLGQFHVRYQPWCPICHPRGGGGDTDADAPAPTGGNGRPLPVA